ncbi:MAG: ATP-binding protein [Balneolales bacterium]|nr:ATP-binding protein [Balneolales bacterium]
MIEKISSIEQFNFWKNSPDVGVVRPRYLALVQKFQDSRLIHVLVGQRRVGKSYILRQIIQSLIDGEQRVLREQTLYINKEFSEFDFIKNHVDLSEFVQGYMNQLEDKRTLYLFIDEVQGIESWEKAVNAFSQDFTNNIRIYITGSNAKLLSGELATHLSGRYVSFLITPFSYDEYLAATQRPNGKQSFLHYLQTGGLPELFRLPDEESKRYYVSAVYDTVILRDIVQRYHIRDVRLLKDIFAFLVNNVGNLLSVNSLVDYFKHQKRKTNYETIAQYLGYLEDAYIIFRCERFQIKGKEILSGQVKYYLNDLSFKNYMYSGFHLGLGHMMENLVYLELITRGYKVYVGQMRGKEVDFVAQKGDETMYLQVAYQISSEETQKREYASLLAIRDNFEKKVISADDVTLPPIEGIRHSLYWEQWGSSGYPVASL